MNWNKNSLIKQATTQTSQTFFIIIKGKFKGRWNFHRFSFFTFFFCSLSGELRTFFFASSLCHWEVFFKWKQKVFLFLFTPFRLHSSLLEAIFSLPLISILFKLVQFTAKERKKKSFLFEGLPRAIRDRGKVFAWIFLLYWR